jgi:hypothetical protein
MEQDQLLYHEQRGPLRDTKPTTKQTKSKWFSNIQSSAIVGKLLTHGYRVIWFCWQLSIWEVEQKRRREREAHTSVDVDQLLTQSPQQSPQLDQLSPTHPLCRWGMGGGKPLVISSKHHPRKRNLCFTVRTTFVKWNCATFCASKLVCCSPSFSWSLIDSKRSPH